MDIVQLVKSGDAYFEYKDLHIIDGSRRLILNVFRDALKIDGAPAMTWDRKPIVGDTRTFDGLRPPATAKEMQQVADELNCMLPTPKILDLMRDEARASGTLFDAVVNVKGNIVAVSNIHDVHLALEAAIEAAGGDNGGFIVPVGKFWVLANALLTGKHSKIAVGGGVYENHQAINYGWYSAAAPADRLSVTKNARVWQNIGGEHNDAHFDPSQVVQLMYRWAVLVEDGKEREVDLQDIAQDPERCHLISHEGPLKVVRLPSVPEPPKLAA